MKVSEACNVCRQPFLRSALENLRNDTLLLQNPLVIWWSSPKSDLTLPEKEGMFLKTPHLSSTFSFAQDILKVVSVDYN